MRYTRVGESSVFINRTCDICNKKIRTGQVVLYQHFKVGPHRHTVRYHRDCMEKVVARAPKTLMETHQAFKAAKQDLLDGLHNGEYGAARPKKATR